MPKLSRKKKTDFFIVGFIITTSAFLSLYFRVDTIVSILLYLGAPSLYLCLRERKNIKKIFAASLLLGVLLGIAYDFIVESAQAWTIHYSTYPFNIIVLGATPLGDFIWAFLILFSATTFYEHFLDDERQPKLSKHATFGLGVGLVSFFIVVCMFVTPPAYHKLSTPI